MRTATQDFIPAFRRLQNAFCGDDIGDIEAMERGDPTEEPADVDASSSLSDLPMPIPFAGVDVAGRWLPQDLPPSIGVQDDLAKQMCLTDIQGSYLFLQTYYGTDAPASCMCCFIA